ncbi:peptidoglycan-binding domain-containing protein [Streptomyces sp. NPDC054933]
MTRVRTFLAVAGLAAVLTAGGASTAQADPGAPWIGPHKANQPHGVWCVQDILNQVDGAGLVEDAKFGPATQGAINYFQAEHHLPNDGIVGPQSGRALLNSLATKRHTTVWDSYCRQYIPT